MACQTARVAYHESYWVVVGTAAPVIALAATVTYSQGFALVSGPDRRVRVFGWVAHVSQGICVLVQVVALAHALTSLTKNSDNGLNPAAVELYIGLFLLLLGGLITAAGRGFAADATGQGVSEESDQEPTS